MIEFKLCRCVHAKYHSTKADSDNGLVIKHALPNKSVYLIQRMIPGSSFLLISEDDNQVQVFK